MIGSSSTWHQGRLWGRLEETINVVEPLPFTTEPGEGERLDKAGGDDLRWWKASLQLVLQLLQLLILLLPLFYKQLTAFSYYQYFPVIHQQQQSNKV